MLENIFVTILRLDLYGTIGGAIILICLLVDHVRVPRWISMALWGMLALRLTLPMSISSDLSVLQFRNLFGYIEETLDFENTYNGDYKTAPGGAALYEKAVAAKSPVELRGNGGIEPAKPLSETILPIAARLWACGVAALWIVAVLSYLHLRSRLRFAIRLSDGVYETDAIASPCVVGIVRPRIYLTPGLTEVQKEHILLHERTHLRYMDHMWKIVSFAVISLHWFNPFLWLLYRLFQTLCISYT